MTTTPEPVRVEVSTSQTPERIADAVRRIVNTGGAEPRECVTCGSAANPFVVWPEGRPMCATCAPPAPVAPDSAADDEPDPLDIEQRARIEALYAAAAVLGGGPAEGDGALYRLPLVGASAEVLDVASWVLTGLTPAAVCELAEAVATEPPTAQVEHLAEVTAELVRVDPAILGWGARIIATVSTPEGVVSRGVRLLNVSDGTDWPWQVESGRRVEIDRTWVQAGRLSDVVLLDAGEPADPTGGEQ